MIKIAWVRGKYLNNFEGQNYRLSRSDFQLTGFASQKPIDPSVEFPLVKLPSLADFETRLTKAIANRTIGDMHLLLGLENFKDKFDIFHSADPYYYYSYQLAKLRAKHLIKKFILTSWETLPFNNETIERKKFIKKFSMENADAFLCYSQRAKRALMKEGVKENKITVIKLGVDLKRFSPKRRSKKNLTILFVGRLVAEKGILDLYEAFKKLSDKRTMLLIVGQGLLKKELLRMRARDGLTHRVIIRTKNYADMPKAYAQADILVVPSKRTSTWEEQYGMVFIEAMASGLPIISYDTGAIAENVGKAGILLKEGDVERLAATMAELVQNRSLRQKIGTMGRERAKKFFDAEKTERQLAKFYRKINGK